MYISPRSINFNPRPFLQSFSPSFCLPACQITSFQIQVDETQGKQYPIVSHHQRQQRNQPPVEHTTSQSATKSE